jgi:hypothetical protein
MNEFALQLGAVICRASMAITSAQGGCYDSAVLGRIGWMAVAGLTLAAIAGWGLRARWDLKQNAGKGLSILEAGAGAELFAYTLERS